MDQRLLEQCWREEKYRVMYHSQKHYEAIRIAMRSKNNADQVISLIEEAKLIPPTQSSKRNALQHMWGYFKKDATDAEKKHFLQLFNTEKYEEARVFLRDLAKQYNSTYLIESLILSEGE